MYQNILKKGWYDNMNKKEAIAYAQITLNFMQSSKFSGPLNPITFGIEMKQAFKLYPRDVALIMANNIKETENEKLL